MKIKTRMFIGVAGAVLFLVVSNLITHEIIKNTNDSIHQVIDVSGTKIKALNKLKNLSEERAVLTRDLVVFESDSKHFSSSKERLKTSAQELSETFTFFGEQPLDKEESRLFESIKENMQSANAVFTEYTLAVDDDFLEEAVEILVTDFQPKYTSFKTLISELNKYEEQKGQEFITELRQNQILGERILWSVLGISVVLFSIIGALVARSFLKPINAMHKTMETIMKTGDLSQQMEVTSQDELGQVAASMNLLNSRIADAIKSVGEVVTEMSEGQFDARITRDSKGDFLVLKNSVNQSMEQIQQVMGLLTKTTQNLRAGNLETAPIEGLALKGQFSDIMYDLSRSTVRMHDTVQSIDGTLRRLALGDFSRRVDADARGEFTSLKDSINATLDNLENFVEEVAQVQGRISDGDMTSSIKGDYHGKMAVLKDSINASTRNVSVMIAKVGSVTQIVADESDAIAQGSDEVSSRIQGQAIALEKTATQMEMMTTTVKTNADNASHTREMTQQAQGKLSSGVETMKKALDSMSDMSAASQKINDIISIIDGIAFQTNLLALNAAVEAARAGEHGRGFAVVAGEVRNLAGKSAEAASEIKGLIENSVRISNESGLYVKQTSDALLEVNHSMDEMASLISDIADASSEQSNGIDSVSGSMSEMDAMTQQSAGLIEETAAATQDLKNESSELQKLVSGFSLDNQLIARMARLQSSEIGQQFEKMIAAHLAWKAKIRAFVEGVDIGVSYEVATDHTSCILGKWYYSDGQEHMHLPLMQTLGKEHEEMHQGIKKVMDAKKLDDTEMVEAGLSMVDKQSEKVVSLLNQLIDEVV